MHFKQYLSLAASLLMVQAWFHFNLTPLQQMLAGPRLFKQGLRTLRTKAGTSLSAKDKNNTQILPSIASDLVLPVILKVTGLEGKNSDNNTQPTSPSPSTTPPSSPTLPPSLPPSQSSTPLTSVSPEESSESPQERRIPFLGNRTEFEDKFPHLDWKQYAEWHNITEGTVSTVSTVSTVTNTAAPKVSLQYTGLKPFIL